MENYSMEYLAHHGTKGMKWGRRLYQNPDGSLTALGRKRYNKELEKIKSERKILKQRMATKEKLDKLEAKRKENEELKKTLGDIKDDDGVTQTKSSKKEKDKSSDSKKDIKKMSDEELNAAIERLKLEQKYTELTATPKAEKKVSNGRKFVGEVLSNSGKNIATQVATFALGVAANKIIGKGYDGNPAINPRKGQKDK